MMPQPEHLYLGFKLYEFVTLVAIVLGPILAVGITVISESRRRKRDQQTQTMRMLVSTRHLPGDPNYTTAINMIPIDFNKNRKVMAAWAAYIEAITYRALPENADAHNKQVMSKQTKLIFEVMKSLGYRLAETDIQTTAYAAGGFIERDNLMLNAWAAWPRIAKALEDQGAALSNPEGH